MIWPFLLGVVIGSVLCCVLTIILDSREPDPFDEGVIFKETNVTFPRTYFRCPHCGIKTETWMHNQTKPTNENKPNP